MDYYKKYKKYKFKYLNLLNQSGGDLITDEDYNKLLSNVTSDGLQLKNINANKTTYIQYLEICKKAIKQNGLALEYVQKDKISPEIYILFCETAVKQNDLALKYVSQEYITKLANKKDDITNCTIS